MSSAHKWCVLFAVFVIASLAISLSSHRWFVTRRAPDTSEESGTLLEMGPLMTHETSINYDGTRASANVTNYRRAAKLAAPYEGDSEMPDDARNAAVFWKAGIVLVVLGALAVFSLTFALVASWKVMPLASRVSPKGLSALSLFFLLLASAVFISHVPGAQAESSSGRIVTATPLWGFYVSAVLGFVANELLARHRRISPSSIPTAIVHQPPAAG